MANVKSIRPAPSLDMAVGWNGGGRSYSGRLAEIGDRYVEILRRNPPPALTEAEVNAIRDVLNGALLQPAAVIAGAIVIEVEDALPDGLADKWGIDGPALVARLGALTYVQEVALLEQVEKYWSRAPDAGRESPR